MHEKAILVGIVLIGFALVHVLIYSISLIKLFKDKYEESWVMFAKGGHFVL